MEAIDIHFALGAIDDHGATRGAIDLDSGGFKRIFGGEGNLAFPF